MLIGSFALGDHVLTLKTCQDKEGFHWRLDFTEHPVERTSTQVRRHSEVFSTEGEAVHAFVAAIVGDEEEWGHAKQMLDELRKTPSKFFLP